MAAPGFKAHLFATKFKVGHGFPISHLESGDREGWESLPRTHISQGQLSHSIHMTAVVWLNAHFPSHSK